MVNLGATSLLLIYWKPTIASIRDWFLLKYQLSIIARFMDIQLYVKIDFLPVMDRQTGLYNINYGRMLIRIRNSHYNFEVIGEFQIKTVTCLIV